MDPFNDFEEIRTCTIPSEEGDSILSIRLPDSRINFGVDENVIPLVFYLRIIKPENVKNYDDYKVNIEVAPTDMHKIVPEPKSTKKSLFGKIKPGGCMKPKTIGSDASLTKGPKIVHMQFKLLSDTETLEPENPEIDFEIKTQKPDADDCKKCPANLDECRPSCTSPCKMKCCSIPDQKCAESCGAPCSKQLKNCSNLAIDLKNCESKPFETYSKLDIASSEALKQILSSTSNIDINERDPSLASSKSSLPEITPEVSDELNKENDSELLIKTLKEDKIIIIEPTQYTNKLHEWFKNMFNSEMNDYHKELDQIKNEITDAKIDKNSTMQLGEENIDIKHSDGMELALNILEDSIKIKVSRQ